MAARRAFQKARAGRLSDRGCPAGTRRPILAIASRGVRARCPDATTGIGGRDEPFLYVDDVVEASLAETLAALRSDLSEPEQLAVQDGGVWRAGVRVALGGLVFLACVLGLALVTTEATPADLRLPGAALASFWLLWLLIHAVASLVNRIRDHRAIRRFFGGEIWAAWRHTADGWRGYVEAEARAMAPQGRTPVTGALLSAILGVGLAGALLAMAHFALTEPQHREIVRLVAAGVFLLLLAIGLFQPVIARRRAAAYARRALGVAEPRVWFGPRGVYEESLGFTPLDALEKVSDDTHTRGAMTFTVSSRVLRRSGEIFSTESYSVRVPIAVPAEHHGEAAALARRYRSLIRA